MRVQGTDPAGGAQFRKSQGNVQAKQGFKKVMQSTTREEKASRGTPTEEQVRQAVDQLNKTMATYNTELRFRVHKESGEIQVSVLNAETEEVIRKIPPDKILNIVAHVKEMLGIIVDEII